MAGSCAVPTTTVERYECEEGDQRAERPCAKTSGTNPVRGDTRRCIGWATATAAFVRRHEGLAMMTGTGSRAVTTIPAAERYGVAEGAENNPPIDDTRAFTY